MLSFTDYCGFVKITNGMVKRGALTKVAGDSLIDKVLTGPNLLRLLTSRITLSAFDRLATRHTPLMATIMDDLLLAVADRRRIAYLIRRISSKYNYSSYALRRMTAPLLKRIARSRNLATRGTRDALITRIMAAQTPPPAAVPKNTWFA
jgi:hypothetical protein